MAPESTTPKYVLLGKTVPSPPDSLPGPSPYADKHTDGPSVLAYEGPLKPSGLLDKRHQWTDLTPGIGREYSSAQLREILADDVLLRDLAITISARGVVVFRNQDLTVEEQKVLAHKLGLLTGKPAGSSLHIHPIAPAAGVVQADGSEDIDPEVSIITSRINNDVYTKSRIAFRKAADSWHSDVNFEPIPADYTILRIIETPETGGDTLWGSGYALYDKLSPSLRAYLETLTGTYAQPTFKQSTDGKFDIYAGKRGAPENVGNELRAVHPIIRTNPVTGWKSVFAIGTHFVSFNGLTDEESTLLRSYLHNLLSASHDIQLRVRWNPNDVAIWDNRSTYHTATHDYTGLRTGVRTVGVGERPFLSPKSTSRLETLLE